MDASQRTTSMSPTQQLRDAAIVLNSLPEGMLSDVLGRLDRDSRDRLMNSMDSLEKVSGEELYRISRRFRSQAFSSGKSVSNESITALIPSSGIAALAWPSDSLGPDTEPFAFLKHMDVKARSRLLEAEHPLNVALVMTTLSPAFASSITRELDPAFRISVIRRLCDLDIVDDLKLMELRYELRMRARRMLAIENCTKQGLTVAADLLSLSDRRTRDGVIAWLSDKDGELGEELKKRVMTMHDVGQFSDKQLIALLKRVDTSAWAGALRSTVPTIVKRILQCMAPRAVDIVNAEMANFDPLDEKAIQWSVEQVIREAMKIRDAE